MSEKIPADPYMRMVILFDRDKTAGDFLRHDGDGGFVAAVSRMSREIDRLRAEVRELKSTLGGTSSS